MAKYRGGHVCRPTGKFAAEPCYAKFFYTGAGRVHDDSFRTPDNDAVLMYRFRITSNDVVAWPCCLTGADVGKVLLLWENDESGAVNTGLYTEEEVYRIQHGAPLIFRDFLAGDLINTPKLEQKPVIVDHTGYYPKCHYLIKFESGAVLNELWGLSEENGKLREHLRHLEDQLHQEPEGHSQHCFICDDIRSILQAERETEKHNG